MNPLWSVLDRDTVRLCADRSVPLHKGTIYRTGDVFDYVARLVWEASEETKETVFVDLMKSYLYAELETDRWGKLVSVARAYGADFKTLVKYLIGTASSRTIDDPQNGGNLRESVPES